MAAQPTELKMTLSTQAREYMEKRDELSGAEEAVVDDTLNEMQEAACELGVHAAEDDRLLELEAALIKFIIDSRE